MDDVCGECRCYCPECTCDDSGGCAECDCNIVEVDFDEDGDEED
jgi:hypothetical protein